MPNSIATSEEKKLATQLIDENNMLFQTIIRKGNKA
jgi:hypothetical protein